MGAALDVDGAIAVVLVDVVLVAVLVVEGARVVELVDVVEVDDVVVVVLVAGTEVTTVVDGSLVDTVIAVEPTVSVDEQDARATSAAIRTTRLAITARASRPTTGETQSIRRGTARRSGSC